MAMFEIIKCDGHDDVYVCKYPTEDFNTLSQLIVNESQEAIFFKDGQALDLFKPGKYTLHTQNIPLLRKLVNIPTGGESPFHCQVYFVNKTMPLDLKWGTDSQIQVLDPKFKILLHAGANGGMGVQIDDSKKFLVNLVGTKNSFDKETLIQYFRELIVTRTKAYLSKIMNETSFVIVNQYLDDISAALKEKLAEDMEEFGVKLINFFVSGIQLRETDYQQVQSALSRASSRDIEGYNWVDEQIAEVSKRYASNAGAQNSPAGMIAQAPLAFAFGNMLRNQAQPFIGQGFSNSPKAFKPQVDTVNPLPFGDVPKEIRPKQTPGNSPMSEVSGKKTIEQRIKELDMLKGKIPEEMYQAKLKEILSDI